MCIDKDTLFKILELIASVSIPIVIIVLGLLMTRKIEDSKNRKRVSEICAKFGQFLKMNAIVACNDAYLEYVKLQLQVESGRVTMNGDEERFQEQRLKTLNCLKSEYEDECNAIECQQERNIHSCITSDEVSKLRDELFAMPKIGQHFRERVEATTEAGRIAPPRVPN